MRQESFNFGMMRGITFTSFMPAIQRDLTEWYVKLLMFLLFHFQKCIDKIKTLLTKIVRNLFQKVFILVQKAANLARFKKNLEKKLKISKTIAELSIVLSFVFFKQ